jgi:hypothetical protein
VPGTLVHAPVIEFVDLITRAFSNAGDITAPSSVMTVGSAFTSLTESAVCHAARLHAKGVGTASGPERFRKFLAMPLQVRTMVPETISHYLSRIDVRQQMVLSASLSIERGVS